MAHGLHGVRGSGLVLQGVGGHVPGRGMRIVGADACGAAILCRSDESGSGAEDGVEAAVDAGFDIDRIGRGLAMYERDVNVESDAEHDAACAFEVGVGSAGAVE